MSDSNEIDLSAYLQSIENDLDKVLYQEAVNAAMTGAHRAAYILIWLSCAESLKRRFRELSSRDGGAQKISSSIEKKEQNQQSVDAYLITQAREYGILNGSDVERLEHIYKMRCVFGHPYEERPNKEELVAAAAAATECLLCKPVRLRHGFLSEQAKRLTENQSYLDDTAESCRAYVEDVIGRVADDLHLWFLRKLWRMTEPIATDAGNALIMRRTVAVSTEYLQICGIDLFDHWNPVDDLVSYPRVLSQITSDPRLFSKLTAQARDIVIGNLLDWGQGTTSHLKRVELLYDCDLLSERQKVRFSERLDGLSVASLAAAGIDVRKYIGLVIRKLESHNWYEQNPAVDVISNLGPASLETLAKSHQFELGQNITQAADGNAGHAIQFLMGLYSSASSWPSSFVEGIMSECVLNDDGRVRFKDGESVHAFRAIKCLGASERKSVILRIADKVRTGGIEAMGPRASAYRQKRVIELLNSVIQSDSDVFSVLASLRDAVAEARTWGPD